MVVVALLAAVVGGVVVSPGRAVDPPLSSACTQLNDPIYDFPNGQGGIWALEELGLEFNAGEHITARTAGIGETPGGDSNTFFQMMLLAAPPGVSLGVVDSASAFPTTLEYTIPTAGHHYRIQWFTAPCRSDGKSRVSTSTRSSTRSTLQEEVTALGKPLAAPFTSKLNEAVVAYEAGNTAGACDSMTAFINQVAAQAGKKGFSLATAQRLIAAALPIRGLLGC